MENNTLKWLSLQMTQMGYFGVLKLTPTCSRRKIEKKADQTKNNPEGQV